MKRSVLVPAALAVSGIMTWLVLLGAQAPSLWSVSEPLGGLTPADRLRLEESTGGPLTGLVNIFRGLPGPDYQDLFAKPPGALQIQIPGGVTLTSELVRRGRFGEINLRFNRGHGVFTTNSQGLYGNFVVDNRFFAVSSFPGRRVSVVEVLYRNTVDHVTEPGNHGAAPPVTNPRCAADSEISILVLASAAVASDPADVAAAATVALDGTTKALSNSGIAGGVSLAGVGIIPFTTTASMTDDVKTLQTNQDALALRAKTGADMVILITDHKQGGHAGKVLADIDSAFAVVSANNLNGPRYTVAHEFGHLLGAGHDSASAHPAFSHGAAYNSTARWCTMMSVETACTGRQQLFSTPHKIWRNEPAGRANLNNASVVQANFSAVAKFNCPP